MKYYYSEKLKEWLISSKNWKKDNPSDWWNDTIVIEPSEYWFHVSSGPDYRYRHELPWHYKRIKVIPKIIKVLAEEWESEK